MLSTTARAARVARTPALAAQFHAGSARLAAKPVMPPCDFKPKPYAGPSFQDVMALRKQHISPGIITYYKNPVLIHQGHMQWLWDDKGNRYLDMFAGIVTVSVGHCHPHTVAAAKEQVDTLWHTTNIYPHPKIHEYAKRLADKMPGNLKVVYFVNSGSEANDLAMLMARLYTGNYDILALRNAYHGMSPYTMGLTNVSTWKYNIPHGFGVHHALNADPYRGHFGGAKCRDSPAALDRKCDCGDGPCKAGIKYADDIKDVIMHSTPGKIAAFFAESIQGVGGTVQFPKGYLKRAYDHVRAHGGLCVADEVQTGFGRLGSHFWGFESHGVMPDIVSMAKGIGNGWPLAAVVTTPEIAKVLSQRLHFNTFGGNPVACAVGMATLDVMEKENTQENCRVVGTHLIERLEGLKRKHKIIGDVRGKGLMLGVEFVKDRDTRVPATEECARVWERAREMGVLLGKGGLYGNVMRIKPPMIITKADADFTADVLDVALSEL